MENKEKMERSTLLDTYLDYHDLVLKPRVGDDNPKRDGMPFIPIFLMDAMNILYEEYIAPLPLKHREKQLRTRWHEAYKHFINEFFVPFNDDQKCEICDLMDGFEEAIHNEVEVFRVAVMDKFMQYDTEIRLVLSATLACNVLAQSAEYLWNALHSRKKQNAYITSTIEWSHKFLELYGDKHIERKKRSIDLNKYNDVNLAVNRICKKVLSYAKSIKL